MQDTGSLPGPHWQQQLAAELLQFGKRLEFRLIARAVRLLPKAVEAAAGIDCHALRDTGVAAVAVLGVIAHAHDVTLACNLTLKGIGATEKAPSFSTAAAATTAAATPPATATPAGAVRATAAATIALTGVNAGSAISASRIWVGSLM